MKQLIAHARKNDDGNFAEPQDLKDHLIGTAKFCEKNAEVFGLSKLAKILGLVHDLGKARASFQERIRLKTGFGIEAHLEGKTAKHLIKNVIFPLINLCCLPYLKYSECLYTTN